MRIKKLKLVNLHKLKIYLIIEFNIVFGNLSFFFNYVFYINDLFIHSIF